MKPHVQIFKKAEIHDSSLLSLNNFSARAQTMQTLFYLQLTAGISGMFSNTWSHLRRDQPASSKSNPCEPDPARCREPPLPPAAMGIESRRKVAGDDQYLWDIGPEGAQISNAWLSLQMCNRNKTSYSSEELLRWKRTWPNLNGYRDIRSP